MNLTASPVYDPATGPHVHGVIGGRLARQILEHIAGLSERQREWIDHLSRVLDDRDLTEAQRSQLVDEALAIILPKGIPYTLPARDAQDVSSELFGAVMDARWEQTAAQGRAAARRAV